MKHIWEAAARDIEHQELEQEMGHLSNRKDIYKH